MVKKTFTNLEARWIISSAMPVKGCQKIPELSLL